jgi:hypothetical protein
MSRQTFPEMTKQLDEAGATNKDIVENTLNVMTKRYDNAVKSKYLNEQIKIGDELKTFDAIDQKFDPLIQRVKEAPDIDDLTKESLVTKLESVKTQSKMQSFASFMK